MRTNIKDFVYTCNFTEANFYISQGLKVYKIGKHRFTKEIFFVFKKEETKEAYQQWKEDGKVLRKGKRSGKTKMC